MENDEAAAPEMANSSCLKTAIEDLPIEINDEQTGQLEAYCHLLWDWNQKVNLTRHTNYDLFARRDLLDSYELAKLIEPGEDVLDVGTGGGVPGILLAILRPDVNVSLCDSVAKKAKITGYIVKKLDLPVAVYPTRVQDVLEDLRFHSLTARAVGSLRKLLSWLEDSWLGFDRLLAIKGPRWVDERKEARHRGLLNGVELRRLAAYNMPGTESESVILQVNRERG